MLECEHGSQKITRTGSGPGYKTSFPTPNQGQTWSSKTPHLKGSATSPNSVIQWGPSVQIHEHLRVMSHLNHNMRCLVTATNKSVHAIAVEETCLEGHVCSSQHSSLSSCASSPGENRLRLSSHQPYGPELINQTQQMTRV